jgi:preprotein translocase subunit SecD
MGRSIMAMFVLALLGCGGDSPPQDEVRIEFRLAETEAGAGLTEAVVAGGVQRYFLHDELILGNADVAAAQVEPGLAGGAQVGLKLREAGAARVARVTADNIGKRVAILVDGVVVAAPVIRDTIPGGRVLITGDFSEAEAERIAAGIMTGR